MELGMKEQKIRDRIIFMFNVIPDKIELERHAVLIDIREVDVERVQLDLEKMAEELSVLLDRKVVIKVVE